MQYCTSRNIYVSRKVKIKTVSGDVIPRTMPRIKCDISFYIYIQEQQNKRLNLEC